ncbi:hypothetical protein C0J52_23214 [Blattella germanica]|nr:hypothetical protein C0J52_23214 [Blattella germanica]
MSLICGCNIPPDRNDNYNISRKISSTRQPGKINLEVLQFLLRRHGNEATTANVKMSI